MNVSPTAPGAMPNQSPPDTKGMTVKQVIKAEVEHALDVLAHNPSIPWTSPFAKVTAALGRVVAIIEASGRESFGAHMSGQGPHEVAWWKGRAEKAEQRADKAEADFKAQGRALSESVAAVERLSKEIDAAVERDNGIERVLEKARVIVDAMLEHFDPRKQGKALAEDGVDKTDADGVAYGDLLGIGTLRYGDLEVASGAMGSLGVVGQPTIITIDYSRMQSELGHAKGVPGVSSVENTGSACPCGARRGQYHRDDCADMLRGRAEPHPRPLDDGSTP